MAIVFNDDTLITFCLFENIQLLSYVITSKLGAFNNETYVYKSNIAYGNGMS